ncbi:hypothetical protein WDM22_38355 [Bradyrhizobium septentrionale]|uniref:hypothetical protein n=1 Tax=Bradyrhizobium septentrionale TaxID=1404411 RepID=UPI0030CFC283
MLLQGYFDDSGSHAGSNWYVLGGFLSTAANWKLFSDAWQEALRKEPAIDYFKMNEARTLDGQFKGWPAALRDQRVIELAEVADKYSVARIAAVMRQEDFNQHIKGVSPWKELDDPYFMLFYQIIVLTANFLQKLGENTDLDVSGAEVDFVFDEQGSIGLNALSWWDVFKQALDPNLLRFLGSSPISAQIARCYHFKQQTSMRGTHVMYLRAATIV